MSVLDVGHDRHATAGKVGPLPLLVVGSSRCEVAEHVIRNRGLADVNKFRCCDLAVYLHHGYAAHRWLHCLCTHIVLMVVVAVL